MTGLDLHIVTHKILLVPGTIPIKQKLRIMNPDTLLKVRDEVKKQYMMPDFLKWSSTLNG